MKTKNHIEHINKFVRSRVTMIKIVIGSLPHSKTMKDLQEYYEEIGAREIVASHVGSLKPSNYQLVWKTNGDIELQITEEQKK